MTRRTLLTCLSSQPCAASLPCVSHSFSCYCELACFCITSPWVLLIPSVRWPPGSFATCTTEQYCTTCLRHRICVTLAKRQQVGLYWDLLLLFPAVQSTVKSSTWKRHCPATICAVGSVEHAKPVQGSHSKVVCNTGSIDTAYLPARKCKTTSAAGGIT